MAFTKPESWIFVSMQAGLDNREKVRLSSTASARAQ